VTGPLVGVRLETAVVDPGGRAVSGLLADQSRELDG